MAEVMPSGCGHEEAVLLYFGLFKSGYMKSFHQGSVYGRCACHVLGLPHENFLIHAGLNVNLT